MREKMRGHLAKGNEQQFDLKQDVVAMTDRFALEALGPDSTTRDDARRFGAFVRRELRRSLGAESGQAMVDLSGVVDAAESLPRLPRATRVGPATITLNGVEADPSTGAIVFAGSVAIADQAPPPAQRPPQ